MSLTLGAYDLEAPSIHGTPVVRPWEVSRTAQRFFGLTGEQQLTGSRHVKEITIPVHYTGYATMVLLLADLTTLATYQESDAATLTIDLGGGDSSSFTNCIFTGFSPDESPWKDGAGVNGWQVRGTLSFRQVAS